MIFDNNKRKYYKKWGKYWLNYENDNELRIQSKMFCTSVKKIKYKKYSKNKKYRNVNKILPGVSYLKKIINMLFDEI